MCDTGEERKIYLAVRCTVNLLFDTSFVTYNCPNDSAFIETVFSIYSTTQYRRSLIYVTEGYVKALRLITDN